MSGNPWNAFLKMNKNNGYKMRELSHMYQQTGGRYRCHKNNWKRLNKYIINLLLPYYETCFSNLGFIAKVSECKDGIIINFYKNEEGQIVKDLRTLDEVCHLTIPCNNFHWFEPYGPFKVHFTLKESILIDGKKKFVSYYYLYDPKNGELNYSYPPRYTDQIGGTQGNKRPLSTDNNPIESKKLRTEPITTPPDVIKSLAIIMSNILNDIFDTDEIQGNYTADIIKVLLKQSTYTQLLNKLGETHDAVSVINQSDRYENIISNIQIDYDKKLKYEINIYWFDKKVTIKRYSDSGKKYDEFYEFYYTVSTVPPYIISIDDEMISNKSYKIVYKQKTAYRIEYKYEYKYKDDIQVLISILNNLLNDVTVVKYYND